jgi:hypothetical protein
MSESVSEPGGGDSGSQSDLQSALFLDMAGQIANLALIFLGRVPHPETGKPVKDLESARTFIDQLEMLEVKTRGNLNKREESFLKQSLMATRMAFVEVMEEQARTAQPPAGTPAGGASSPEPGPASGGASGDPNADAEARKKFVKKY